jgi:two-component system nitrate/nitrite response regulator NarL
VGNGVWEEPYWNTGTVRIIGPRPATIVVELRQLVRKALKSLMEESSYRVVCEVGSMSGIGLPTIGSDEPGLVVLGAQSANTALNEADSARRLWPDSKIILLYEYASPADFQKLLKSEINGCVPLFASPDTIISALDMIVTRDARVMVVADANHPVIQPVQANEPHQSEIEPHSHCAQHDDIPVSTGAIHAKSPTNGGGASNRQRLPRITEREAQILDGLVNGQSNGMIARACDITEATVKAHMKSIMRKIRVENRTQAAIWALENGYSFDQRLWELGKVGNDAA